MLRIIDLEAIISGSDDVMLFSIHHSSCKMRFEHVLNRYPTAIVVDISAVSDSERALLWISILEQ